MSTSITDGTDDVSDIADPTGFNCTQILLADDNAGDCALLQEAFSEAGIAARFVVARNGIEAMELLARGAGGFHLLILDIKLPGMNGANILDHVKQRADLGGLVTYMMTQSDSPAHRARCSAADGYFTKAHDWSGCVATARAIAARFKSGMTGLTP